MVGTIFARPECYEKLYANRFVLIRQIKKIEVIGKMVEGKSKNSYR